MELILLLQWRVRKHTWLKSMRQPKCWYDKSLSRKKILSCSHPLVNSFPNPPKFSYQTDSNLLDSTYWRNYTMFKWITCTTYTTSQVLLLWLCPNNHRFYCKLLWASAMASCLNSATPKTITINELHTQVTSKYWDLQQRESTDSSSIYYSAQYTLELYWSFW